MNLRIFIVQGIFCFLVQVSIALCSMYLLFGISLLAMSFNLVQEQVIHSVKRVATRLGIIRDEEE